jgi:hypothetical protein
MPKIALMAENIDLHTLLRTYSNKTLSHIIDINTFIKFLERNINNQKPAAIKLASWKGDTHGKVMSAIAELLEQNKIEIQTSNGEEKIVLPNYFAETISKAYLSINDSGRTPFPSAEDLRLKIPMPQMRSVTVENDLLNYLNEQHTSPAQIIKLIFPNKYLSAVSLEMMYPTRMLEIAVIKIEDAMRQRSEMEFFSQKLMSHHKGQESKMRDFINVLMTRPMEAVKNIEESSDFTYSTWMFLCPVIRKHVEDMILRNNDEMLPEQLAMIQAESLVFTFNNFYQIKSMGIKDKKHAFGAIDNRMSDPPYSYTTIDILNFTAMGGAPILARYTSDDLDVYLAERTLPGDNGKLPPLLKYRQRDGTECFVKKEKVFNLCTKLLVDARGQIKNDVCNRWMKLLREYKTEAAMEKDSQFEDLLFRLANLYVPLLIPIIQDNKTAMLQAEILMDNGTLPRNEVFFDGDRPLPLRKLLILQRAEIIKNAKLTLPFWYSIGPIVTFMRFLKSSKNRPKTVAAPPSKTEGKPVDNHEKLRESAMNLAKELVPDGTTIDHYLDTLNDRWNQLLNAKDQEQQRTDVNLVIRGYANRLYKVQKAPVVTKTMLDDCAESIVRNTPAFSKINNKNALRLYIKVYMTKLLGLE